ncbi:MAG: TIGR03619 family F420-dependent LLM class oxidoreductase [Dehalococcoidia bacterium]|nr:TIGR03619 family F420-dependent LLM class oxidoreductase [Dehalococcoidia bacterium]
MKFGITMFPADFAMNPVALARAVEERGFESLLLPEHTHMPIDRRSVSPTGREVTEEYWHTIDPFVSLGAAAAVTTNLKLGTGICLVIERDPIVLAKEVASLDFISNGRFLFGIGGGWNEEEMANHGTDPRTRFALMRDQIAAMKAIWTQDEAEYHGRFVDFDPIWSWPKPVQKPHPPIMIGGGGPNIFKRIVGYGDGWLARAPDFTPESNAELQRMAEEAGRQRIPVAVFGVTPTAELTESYVAEGVDRCILRVPPVAEAEALRVLDEHAEFVGRLAAV